VERALNARTLQLEDYSNYQYNARMVAVMHGFPSCGIESVMVPIYL
jgi:hypothetical protein